MTDQQRRRRVRIGWSTAAAIVLAWPARTIGWLDGIPFDTAVDAVLLGVLLPALWWFDRSVFDRSVARALVVALLALKIASSTLLTQAGFCTEFRAEQPIVGQIEAIQFDDPTGVLPSWDARGTNRCSAITARPYRSRQEFPTWFVNLLDAVNPRQPRVTMRTTGAIVARHPGRLALGTTPEMEARLEVDGRPTGLATDGGGVEIGAGVHTLSMTARLYASTGKFEPTWDGADLWTATQTTIAPPTTLDRLASPWIARAIFACALALLALWSARAAASAALTTIEWIWVAAAAATLGVAGHVGLDRAAVPLLFAVLLLPAVSRRANVRGAFLLIGIPWLALFVSASFDRIGAFSTYTRGNDWLTYQISAYRIYRFGSWFYAGEPVFYYQPLYRWICGALHLLFGDSSVGELYWDAACLLAAALLALHVAKRVGRLPALIAAVSTLSIAALGPIWYLIGRGLAEISAMGFATLAMIWALRAGRAGAGAAAVAGAFAVLAFYTRLNHMLFAVGLAAFLIPLRVKSSALRRPLAIVDRVHWSGVATYAVVLMVGLLILAGRTAYFTGRFSIFQGTSLTLNYLGLDPAKIAHSVLATAIGNESFDVRGLPILAGVVAALLAVLQVPGFSTLPLAPAVVCLAGMAGAFIAHAHGYPGRFSVHLLPIATALTVITVANGLALIGRRPHSVAADRAARPGIA
jgi:hypothetical protein